MPGRNNDTRGVYYPPGKLSPPPGIWQPSTESCLRRDIPVYFPVNVFVGICQCSTENGVVSTSAPTPPLPCRTLTQWRSGKGKQILVMVSPQTPHANWKKDFFSHLEFVAFWDIFFRVHRAALLLAKGNRWGFFSALRPDIFFAPVWWLGLIVAPPCG